MHPLFGYIYIADKIEGLILVGAGTTIDVRRDSRDDQRNSLSIISVVISLAALATIIVIELIKR